MYLLINNDAETEYLDGVPAMGVKERHEFCGAIAIPKIVRSPI